MNAAKKAWRFLVVLAKIFAGLMMVAIALFVYLAYDYAQGSRDQDPDWLLIDVRFQTPTGYEVMQDSWIAKGDATLTLDRAMGAGADPHLKELTQGIEGVLGARPSIHWMYCARARIADEWILSDDAVRAITQPQLQQLASAYQKCLSDRDRIAGGNHPRRYATRSIRHEISEHVSAKAGLNPISEATRTCIHAHRTKDDFLACMAKHETRIPPEVIHSDWEGVLNLVESLRSNLPKTSTDITADAG